jgi:integrase
MSQNGYVFKKGRSWFLRYWTNVLVDGQMVRKQKCGKLAPCSDVYRSKGAFKDLVKQKLASVEAADKCPQSSTAFVEYVERTYLPFVLQTKKASTYAGYCTYFERYIRPRAGKYALGGFTVAIVSELLDGIANDHKVNTETIGKVRSILSGIFTYAMAKGHFPGKNASENPASSAMIPEAASEPCPTTAATREEVMAILGALKDMPLERAAVATVTMLGVRPGEARGLRWEDWDRAKQQIHVERSVWHTIEGTTKTEQSVRFLAVSGELREVLLALWNERGCPLGGYILAGPRGGRPVILDNLAKRSIRKQLEKANLTWPGWYSLRRFHGTEVRAKSSIDTTAKALGNSPAIADKHYNKPTEVLPDVRKAVNDAVSGLIH